MQRERSRSSSSARREEAPAPTLALPSNVEADLVQRVDQEEAAESQPRPRDGVEVASSAPPAVSSVPDALFPPPSMTASRPPPGFASWPQNGADRRREGDAEETETDSHDEDESGEEELDDISEEVAEVMQLRCANTDKNCSVTLTMRGMKVYLVTDPSSALFSSDIPTEAVREGDRLELSTCACHAHRLHCAECATQVGYHVVEPCRICASAEHNGHFWLFDAAVVRAEPRGMLWSELPYNGAEDGDADLAEDGQLQAERCVICLSCPMWRPTRVRGCGHVFCFGCISREVDARGRCPIDRLPIKRADLEPVTATQPVMGATSERV